MRLLLKGPLSNKAWAQDIDVEPRTTGRFKRFASNQLKLGVHVPRNVDPRVTKVR